MPDLSVLIPSRNEMFLSQTVKNVLENIEGNTEIIVVLDGAPAEPPLPTDPRLRVISHDSSIGQRAATNEAARLSVSTYIMKLDAHCALDKGFDVKLIADFADPNWTIVPRMFNLHAFDWVCDACGKHTYQGPERPCECGSSQHREIVWYAKPNPTTDAMRFDKELHFQYWRDYKKRQKGDISDTMSLLGACWMMRRDRYWDLDGMDERHGSWGQMGTEIACKTWLSGGELKVNKKTWFSHMFRTQAGFGFPYPCPDAAKARRHSKWLWIEGNWEKAKYPLSWLIEKFKPVPDWHDGNGDLIK